MHLAFSKWRIVDENNSGIVSLKRLRRSDPAMNETFWIRHSGKGYRTEEFPERLTGYSLDLSLNCDVSELWSAESSSFQRAPYLVGDDDPIAENASDLQILFRTTGFEQQTTLRIP